MLTRTQIETILLAVVSVIVLGAWPFLILISITSRLWGWPFVLDLPGR